jgi:hypothetical protein
MHASSTSVGNDQIYTTVGGHSVSEAVISVIVGHKYMSNSLILIIPSTCSDTPTAWASSDIIYLSAYIYPSSSI